MDIAVKYGVLGEVGGGVVGTGVVKLVLKKVIEELDLYKVQYVFICPISLELMQDPVTLCTSQTYDRPNIYLEATKRKPRHLYQLFLVFLGNQTQTRTPIPSMQQQQRSKRERVFICWSPIPLLLY